METTAIIIAAAALAVAIVALLRRPKQEVVQETTGIIDHPPVEHPFIYDSSRSTYVLDGSLEVTGGIASLKNQEKEG